MARKCDWMFVAAALVWALGACSEAKVDSGGGAGMMDDGASGAAAGTSGAPVAGASGAAAGAGGTVIAGGGGAAAGAGGAAGGAAGSAGEAGAAAGASGEAGGTPDPMEMLDPNVDWTALTLVYPTMYSAYDGVHTFQVPVYVDGATVELGDWSAIPSRAVTFDEDPDSGGVLVTIVEDVPEITIAARSGPIGGTAPLYVTSATPEQWEAGEARYANGVEFTIDIDFGMAAADFAAMLLDPNWEPPTPPPDLACNNCHTTGAKYFEIQHTPTQAARYSDEDLKQIMTTGTKPDGADFRVLPEMLGSLTQEELYAQFHKWEASDEELTGVIVYMRSLTPAGQGDILLPDGTYVAPGTAPPGLMP